MTFIHKLFQFLRQKFTNQYHRPLTENEKRLAKSVFGNSLNTDTIYLKTAFWVLKDYAVAPNGNIYYHKANWQDDFATQNLSRQAWLIHELTHAWQAQNGIWVFWRALFNRKYRYKFKAGKSFFDYGVEQQASMVEDYYIRKNKGLPCDEWITIIPFLNKNEC